MKDETILKSLREIQVFSLLDEDSLVRLADAAELSSVKAGEVIFNQGDSADRFFLVYSGKVRILKQLDGREINLGVKSRNDHFGETALIFGSVRNAAARAVEDSVLLSIGKEDFDAYVFSSPETREYFDKFIKSASIQRFIKTCTGLAALPPKDLQALVKGFQPEFFAEGDVVFRQGALPDKFYLLERGKVKVVRWEDGEQSIINFLKKGDFFGEKAFLEETTRYADVVCLTDCHIYSLDKETFGTLVAASEKLKKVLNDRINSYLTDPPPIPYHEVIKQELEASKKISVASEEPASRETRPESPSKQRSPFLNIYYQYVHFPFIRQPDEMACGTTCLMMISRHYGKKFSNSRLRDLAHVDQSGSSLANLANAAEELGFMTRGMKIGYEALTDLSLPCIIHWQGYHYIVVYKADKKHVWVADPALGLRKYTKNFFVENWNGITLCLEPTPKFDKNEEDVSSFKNFKPFIAPHTKILFEVFVASLLLNVFGLATPIFTQNIIDKVLYHNNPSLLDMMLAGMVLVIVFRVLVGGLRQYLIVHTSMKIDLTMLIAFYKHMLALPLGYFKVRKIGDFLTRFGENQKIRNFLTNTALSLLLDTISIVVYFLIMFYYNSKMALLVVFVVPVFAIITLVFTPILKKLNIDSFAARAEADSLLIESVNGIDTVKALNTEQVTRWKWENKFINNLNIDFKLFNTALYFHSLGEFVSSLSSTLVLWYGAQQVMAGAISVGELMAFMALLGSVIAPIDRVIKAWDNVQQILVSIDRLNDIFTAKTEFPEESEDAGAILSQINGEIVFDKVFFKYGGEDAPYILANINLKIRPGQKVAVVGRSGSGKSTLVKLLPRFYDVGEGTIFLDGHDIRSLRLSDLRRQIGFVLQDNFMFNGTIRENIAMGDPDEILEKVTLAAKLANAHSFITSMALGYETKIGESGIQLSGGQKQRISIARALYRNPKIIIFDEATSALDSESEQAIQKNMRTILQNRTAIIIAHRLSTVRDADWIVVLDNGEIVEQGGHEELMQKKGLYHYLNHQQLEI